MEVLIFLRRELEIRGLFNQLFKIGHITFFFVKKKANDFNVSSHFIMENIILNTIKSFSCNGFNQHAVQSRSILYIIHFKNHFHFIDFLFGSINTQVSLVSLKWKRWH